MNTRLYWNHWARCASVFVLVTCMSLSLAAAAAPLTLKRVLLSNGGVGYFEYQAEVEGNAELTLEAPLNQVDDILKSLVIYDDAGAVSHITLPGKESLEQIFRDLPFSPAALSSAVDLLNAVQGATVEINGASALRGQLLKVTAETVALPNQQGSVTRHRLTLMTAQGLRQALLEDSDTVRFSDPALQQQVQKALNALNEHRAQSRRTLQVQVKGQGKRTVHAGYVVEAPLWKTSYRLTLAANPQPNEPAPSRLQGWAILENMSGQDWEGVELTLASGNPVTFRQALYQAYFVKRPEVPVEILGRVLPRLDLGTVAMAAPAPAAPAADAVPMAAGYAGRAALAPEEQLEPMRQKSVRAFSRAMLAEPAPLADAATGTEGAEQVLFTLPMPVSVKNGYSAMLPIADRSLPTLRVSLFQPTTQERHPLASVEITNDTTTSLPPGVITLYEQGHYLGDGRLAALPAGDKRLISFAVDSKITLQQTTEQASKISQGRISDGLFHSTTLEQQTTTYRIKSLHSEDRLLWLEHPQQGNWQLTTPDPTRVALTPDAYRIPQVLKPNAEIQLPVTLQSNVQETVSLADLGSDQIAAYAIASELNDSIRQAFSKIGEWRGQIGSLEQEIAQLEAQRQAVFKDQERLRENLARAPANSDLAKRYLKKLDEQETTLESLQTATQEKQTHLDQLQRQLADYIRPLTL